MYVEVSLSELAYNINGEPFEVPSRATNWRVKRLKPKGAPEVVYGRDGLPLLLSADADLEELRNEVEAIPGRYRLDALDGNNKPIEGASGYVMVHALTRTPANSNNHSSDVVLEAMRMNAEMARAIIERFPAMMDSAATLLRAADGAGLPLRTPIIDDSTDEEIDQEEDRASFDLQAIVAQIVPLVLAGLSNRKKLKAPASADADSEHPRLAKAAPSPMVTPVASPVTNAHGFAHIAAIQAALTPEEAALAREVSQDLDSTELSAWFAELAALSVPQAVARVRAALRPAHTSEADA